MMLARSIYLFIITAIVLFLKCLEATKCKDNAHEDQEATYVCRCVNNDCDRLNNMCSEGCRGGWMGRRCQFAIAKTDLPEWATDDYSSTCNKNASEITANLLTSHPLNFLVVESQTQADLGRLKVSYVVGDAVYECPTPKNWTLTTRGYPHGQREIVCPERRAVSSVTLSGEGVRSLCTIKISKGRELYLRKMNFTSTRVKAMKPERGQVHSLAVLPERNVVHSLMLRQRVVENSRAIDNTNSMLFIALYNEADSVFYTFHGIKPDEPLTLVGQNVQEVKEVTLTYLNDTVDVLSEFEVVLYGDCAPGKFGIDCNYDCNCHTGVDCSPAGQCATDCYPGYMGNNCEHRCKHMFYGPECKMPCHDRCNQSGCNHVTGECLNGCSSKDLEDVVFEEFDSMGIIDPGAYNSELGNSRDFPIKQVMGAVVGVLAFFAALLLVLLNIGTQYRTHRQRDPTDLALSPQRLQTKTSRTSTWGSNVGEAGSDSRAVSDFDSVVFPPTVMSSFERPNQFFYPAMQVETRV